MQAVYVTLQKTVRHDHLPVCIDNEAVDEGVRRFLPLYIDDGCTVFH